MAAQRNPVLVQKKDAGPCYKCPNYATLAYNKEGSSTHGEGLVEVPKYAEVNTWADDKK